MTCFRPRSGRGRQQRLWSVTYMRRRLQHPLGWGALFFGLALTLILAPGSDVAGALGEAKPAEHKAYVETIPDTKVSFTMVPIPGGTYLMGSPANEPGREADEGPQHPVKIAPFWMGKCEVTWDEYDTY